MENPRSGSFVVREETLGVGGFVERFFPADIFL